jgi:hypothetical protein
MVIHPHPLCGVHLDLIKVLPLVLSQPFVTHGSVEPFGIGVLLELAGLNIVKVNAPSFRPILDRAADLWPTVTKNDLWLARPGNDLHRCPLVTKGYCHSPYWDVFPRFRGESAHRRLPCLCYTV